MASTGSGLAARILARMDEDEQSFYKELPSIDQNTTALEVDYERRFEEAHIVHEGTQAHACTEAGGSTAGL